VSIVSSGVATSILGTAYAVITTGLGGIGLLAFFFRWIVPGSVLDDARTERDEWKALYEEERKAHQATKDAYAAASQRSDAGVEAARVAVALVDAFKGAATLPPGRDPGNR
jgi:hypothetical protein